MRRSPRVRRWGRLPECRTGTQDILAYTGAPTVWIKILEGWLPPYDATVTRRLLDHDIVILGKTNLDEFAMGSSTENSAYGPTRNPWDFDRIQAAPAAGRPRQWPPLRPRWRSERTRVARSGSQPLSPAPSA